MTAFLRLEEVSAGYPGKPGVVRHLSLTLETDPRTPALAPNGAGKPTPPRLLEEVGQRRVIEPRAEGAHEVLEHRYVYAAVAYHRVALDRRRGGVEQLPGLEDAGAREEVHHALPLVHVEPRGRLADVQRALG